jgi:hypothetical protein
MCAACTRKAAMRLLYVGVDRTPLSAIGAQRHASWASEVTQITINYYDTPRMALDEERRVMGREKPLYRTFEG